MGVPIIFRNVNDSPAPEFDNVMVDIVEGGYILTKHLLENGYSRVALLGGFAARELSENTPPSGLAKGYVRAHEEAGRTVDSNLAIVCHDDGSDAGDRLIEHLKRYPGCFDGVLVQSNSKLPGLYRAFATNGIRIGKDVGVATITDSEFCHLGETPITAWEQPIEKICTALVEAFFERMNNKKSPSRSVFFPSQLIVRKSSSKIR